MYVGVRVNPRIKRIPFHTLRHFYGSMEYYHIKDILHVKERFGPKDSKSPLIHTHLVNLAGDECHIATVKTIKEDKELSKAGLQYVTERNGVKSYRKRN
jgi:hypothetical protein